MEHNPTRPETKHSHSATSSTSSNAPITTTTVRSDPPHPHSSYPTTFVQADTTSFKQVVQMLTGSSETAKQAQKVPDLGPCRNSIPTAKNPVRKQQGFKLHERRNSMKNGFKISPLNSGFNTSPYGLSPRKTEAILSPSMLDFPALVLSPVTPLMTDPFLKGPNPVASGLGLGSGLDVRAEEKAIKEKGFFLHSSPREAEPKLLPLFPVTSPASVRLV